MSKAVGLPEGLLGLARNIFDELPAKEANAWALDWIKATPVNVSESAFAVIRDNFQIFWLERQLDQIFHEKFPEVGAAIVQVIGLLRSAVSGIEPDRAAWDAAWRAAWREVETVWQSKKMYKSLDAAEAARRMETAGAASTFNAQNEAEAALWRAAGGAAESARRYPYSVAGCAGCAEKTAAASVMWEFCWWCHAFANRDWLLSALANLESVTTP